MLHTNHHFHLEIQKNSQWWIKTNITIKSFDNFPNGNKLKGKPETCRIDNNSRSGQRLGSAEAGNFGEGTIG